VAYIHRLAWKTWNVDGPPRLSVRVERTPVLGFIDFDTDINNTAIIDDGQEGSMELLQAGSYVLCPAGCRICEVGIRET
jgi:hypothetical protein